MGDKSFGELFCKIQEATGVKDIGYHEIRDGRLWPKCKTEMGLAIESWKDTHENNTVYIKNDPLLMGIVSTGNTVVIDDVENDPRSSSAFCLFGIQSIMIVPVTMDNRVKAIICIASIGQKHQFTQSEIKACKLIVEDFIKQTKGDF